MCKLCFLTVQLMSTLLMLKATRLILIRILWLITSEIFMNRLILKKLFFQFWAINLWNLLKSHFLKLYIWTIKIKIIKWINLIQKTNLQTNRIWTSQNNWKYTEQVNFQEGEFSQSHFQDPSFKHFRQIFYV